jgi:hypothetical protein
MFRQATGQQVDPGQKLPNPEAFKGEHPKNIHRRL